ncbi:MAG TPA: GYF domain-containing protein [Polyangiaceae bacterium]|nr:GYF domain-containing protein [Polyangiaceae bacterium]
MKLSCPSCGAKYSIADEKVQDRLAKIRCRKCSATIIVDGKVEPPNVYTSEGGSVSQSAPLDAGDAGAGPAPGEYSVDFGDNDQRTMTADDIVQAYRRGQLTADTYVWTEGMADWQPVGSVPELAEALTAAAPAAASAPPRAARTGSGRGSTTDLFGGIDKAGSEEDVMTSAPQAAVAPSPPVATGARNESSVLFSLSALTASNPVPTRSTAASDTKGEDSGLIDLKALTSAAGSLPPPNPLALGSAPLGMAAPLGGMTAPALAVEGPAQRGGGSKTGLYIAGALVLVGALIAGAIVFTSGNRDAASAANAAVTTPVAVPAAAPQPTQAATPEPEAKKDEPTAQPPSTGTAVAEAAPKDAPTKQASTSTARPAASHKKASSSSSQSSSTTSTPVAEKPAPAEKPAAASTDTSSSAGAEKKKPAPKKEKTCNCSPGDLMCAMKCAAS